jgi:hypothetical protein
MKMKKKKVWTLKVIFSLCLILLAIKKNSSAMAKESNSESGGDAKKMYECIKM